MKVDQDGVNFYGYREITILSVIEENDVSVYVAYIMMHLTYAPAMSVFTIIKRKKTCVSLEINLVTRNSTAERVDNEYDADFGVGRR